MKDKIQGKGISADTITAIAATVIAIVALSIAVWDHVETRRNNRLAVMPILGFVTSMNNGDGKWPFRGFAMENRGLGPALLDPPLLLIDDKPVALMTPENSEVIGKALRPPAPIWWFQAHQAHILKPGELRELLWLQDPKNSTGLEWLRSMNGRIDIVLMYTSLYREDVVLGSLTGNEQHAMQHPSLKDSVWQRAQFLK